MSLAVLYERSAYSLTGKVMGRQSAGAAFLQALADDCPAEVFCYTGSRATAQEFAQTLSGLGATRTGIRWIPTDQPQQLAEAGLLYRPDPGIGQHAWHRLARSDPRAYSVCGVTMTISSHGPMSAFAEWLTSPVESWDAVICISTGTRDAIRHVLEESAEFLRERVGAVRFTLPQLPVIPLGVHTRRFAFSPDERDSARARLGLSEDEVAVLFAGRLIVHGKAHPLPMYLALEEAAQGRKVVLIQAGKAPNAEILKIFADEPKRFCPSVRNVMVDGGDFSLYQAAWAASDIFTSLSDNIQESYGLTPVEAMAAGLPVVVSDWDGYKDTVRHGIDGFRVPTLTLPPGSGWELADRHDMGIDDFDRYSAYASQLVAVDVQATAQAYRQLIDDPDLRRRMGAAGARRAREMFDSSVVFRQYRTLWGELAERRRADPRLTPPVKGRRRPDRPDPFSMFSTYPTYHVGPGLRFRRRAGVDVGEAVSRRELASTNFARPVLPAPDLVVAILGVLGDDSVPYETIVKKLEATPVASVHSALVWLSKVGVLDFGTNIAVRAEH